MAAARALLWPSNMGGEETGKKSIYGFLLFYFKAKIVELLSGVWGEAEPKESNFFLRRKSVEIK